MPDLALSANRTELEAKINALLPPRYVGCFEAVPPTSMGSAKLRYDSQGRVAWGEIWTTFCHLALAGGPPHRGRFLGPVAPEEVQASPEQQSAVVAELQRALKLCVDLPLHAEASPGWIGLDCADAATASWLVQAIVAENVVATHDGATLYVPAGPSFRIEKEIKNVVVCVAKTCHYLFDHLEPEQQPTGAARPLLRAPWPGEIAASSTQYEAAVAVLQNGLEEATGLKAVSSATPGWIGVDCTSEEAAVWLLRAVAVEDVLVRREGAVLFVPVDFRSDAALEKTRAVVANAHRLSPSRNVPPPP